MPQWPKLLICWKTESPAVFPPPGPYRHTLTATRYDCTGNGTLNMDAPHDRPRAPDTRLQRGAPVPPASPASPHASVQGSVGYCLSKLWRAGGSAEHVSSCSRRRSREPWTRRGSRSGKRHGPRWRWPRGRRSPSPGAGRRPGDPPGCARCGSSRGARGCPSGWKPPRLSWQPVAKAQRRERLLVRVSPFPRHSQGARAPGACGREMVPAPSALSAELGSAAPHLGQGFSRQRLPPRAAQLLLPRDAAAQGAAPSSFTPLPARAPRPATCRSTFICPGQGISKTQRQQLSVAPAVCVRGHEDEPPPGVNRAFSPYLQFPPGIEFLQFLLSAVHMSKFRSFPGDPGMLQSLVDRQSLLGVQDNQFSDL